MTEPFYHIQGFCPTIGLSKAGFSIMLWPSWRDAVAMSTDLNQEKVNNLINSCGQFWLNSCGFTDLSSKSELLFQPRDLRIKYGDWGIEHISIPGNACGFDLSKDDICSPKNGCILLPHNVDSMGQACLLLTIFSFFADIIILKWMLEN